MWKSPKGKPQTLNPYSYGVNGPLRHPDPSGRLPFDFFLEQEAACFLHDPASEHPPPDYCPSDPAEESAPAPSTDNSVYERSYEEGQAGVPPGAEGGGGSYPDEGDQAEQPPLPGLEDDGGDGSEDGGSDGGGGVEPYEVGTYEELKDKELTGDELEIHHVPQAGPVQDQNLIDDYDYDTAPAIVLPEDEHAAITAEQNSAEYKD